MTHTPTEPTKPRADVTDPQPLHGAVLVLCELALDASFEPGDLVTAKLRAAHLAHKLLCEVEARNAALADSDADTRWTRLDTMAPLHPDDQRLAEAAMAQSRLVVLEQGRRAALRDLGLDPDADEHAHAASGDINSA